MNRTALPRIRLEAKPPGLKFKPPASAVARFDKSKSVHAAAKAAGEIEILGEIGDSGWGGEFTTAKMVKDQLKAIGSAPVLVTINSPGGDAFEGVAIYNLLREHPARVTTNVLGLAASAASIIAMAGDTIKMGEAAFLMIHSSSGIVVGNQADMREFADLLDTIDASMASLYAARTGKPTSEIVAMMRKETWLTAAEAVKAGFADVAVADDKKKTKAAADAAILASTPPHLLAASGRSQRPVVRLSASPPGASGTPAARRPGVVYLKPPKESAK
jgi:ATP-dependent Clp protease protease subunit